MNNSISMSADFERQKNLQASAYTGGITGALLLLFILVKWSTPVKIETPTPEYIEINLGSSDQGFGTNQPLLPGNPAAAQRTAYTPPQPVHATQQSVKDVSTNENATDAPPVIKPTVSKPDATKINAESKTVKTKLIHTQPVVQTPPRPKAILGHVVGGNGNGGNAANTYKPGGNQGIAGGNGDQGRIGGDPNGKNYTGRPRNLGIRIINFPTQNYTDDFKESGKIMLDIIVDENGKLISSSYQPKGSTIANQSQIQIAKRLASIGPYPKYPGGLRQTIQVNFQVKN